MPCAPAQVWWQVMGWPAQILPYPGCTGGPWERMDCTTKDGSPLVPSKECAAHIWPEVWRSEGDGAKYTEYVLGKETVNSAGTKRRTPPSCAHMTCGTCLRVTCGTCLRVTCGTCRGVRAMPCRADSTGPRSVARGMPSLVMMHLQGLQLRQAPTHPITHTHTISAHACRHTDARARERSEGSRRDGHDLQVLWEYSAEMASTSASRS